MNRTSSAFAIVLAAWSAQAAPFADPFLPPQQATAAGAKPRAGSSAPADGSRLESVLIAPDRRVAIIDGQPYAEGDRFGDGRVLRISEAEVIIRRANRDEALKLFPTAARRTSPGSRQGEQP